MSRGVQDHIRKTDLAKLVSELLKSQPNITELKSFCKKLEIPFSKDPVQLMTTVLTSFDDISSSNPTNNSRLKTPKAVDL